MTTLLQELSKKAAERWAAVLLGPGLLFVIGSVVANRQRFDHALDLDRLRAYVRALAGYKSHQEPGRLVVTAAVVLLSSALMGLVATSAGRFVEHVWMPTRPQWYVDSLTRRRVSRWERADSALTAAVTEAGRRLARDRLLGTAPPEHFPAVRRLRARRAAVSERRPDQPTWLAQRMDGAAERVRQRYSLDLAAIWPHVWAVADGQVREDVRAVRDNYAVAGRLAAWGGLYLALALATGWWPAALFALALLLTARRRARDAIDTLAVLVESTVDLYVRDVAERLGVACSEPFSAATASRINIILRPAGP
ncbi:hypothetical protein ACFXKC_37030 [Streptomyces sp. NPDC059340]|uniref:hypothetical protein n=1 Tax=Streptomyces sp. NPDC059340 TaxID=3346806 RepID=UPI00367E571E